MCKTNLDLNTLGLRYDKEHDDDEFYIHCELGDFSSAWDSYTDSNMYTNGPSLAELTIEYAPPEAVLGSPWKSFHKKKPQSYDSWSIGVLALGTFVFYGFFLFITVLFFVYLGSTFFKI